MSERPKKTPQTAHNARLDHEALCPECRYGTPCEIGRALEAQWRKLANEAMDLIWESRRYVPRRERNA